MNRFHSSRARRAAGGAAGCAALLLCGSPALRAQYVDPGETRVPMSDVTGPSVASLLLFEPGTVKTFDCPVAWGVRTAAEQQEQALRADLAARGNGAALAAALAAPSRRELLEVLMAGDRAGSASAALVSALADSAGRGGAGAARDLVRRLRGLLAMAERMDPRRPGYETATRLSAAVGSFNLFVDGRSASFLASPPAAFLDIQQVLSQLVIAALENEGREVSVDSRRGVGVRLACEAPQRILAQPAPPPERAIQVCVATDAGVRWVPALLRPSTGDTLVVVKGERRPLSAAYPDTLRYPASEAWLTGAEPVRFGGKVYVAFGPRRMLGPEALIRLGEYEGIPIFGSGDDRGAKSIYVVAAPRCIVQGFHVLDQVRKRGR
ncbi:MAG TPA: hypothetical protein VFQ38_02490 [Longimicrobiales bacterium]|nr:hypothetical protein [Longimicrobiales bacterium]